MLSNNSSGIKLNYFIDRLLGQEKGDSWSNLIPITTEAVVAVISLIKIHMKIHLLNVEWGHMLVMYLNQFNQFISGQGK